MKSIHTKIWRLFRRPRNDRAGNAMLETAMILPILFGLSVGSLEVGMVLDRYLQMEKIARSSANMYSRGVDLQQPGVKALLIEAADGIPLVDDSSGTAAMYLSRISVASAGVNEGFPVVRERVVLGNAELGSSHIASPVADAGGHVADYENQAAARATLPDGVVLTGTQELFVAEILHRPSDLKIAGFIKTQQLYRAAFF
jgi:hypothetical protein